MLQKNKSGPRVWRSALALKTYFERRLGQTLELLTEAPLLAVNGDIPLGPELKDHGLWGLRPHGPLSVGAINEISATFEDILGTSLSGAKTDTTNLVAFPSRPLPKKQTQGDCLIECASGAELHKMAFELHSLSGRYAFLSFQDLEAVSRTYVPDLLALGTLTLFIPDLSELTLDEQSALQKLTSIRSVERPFVMVGSHQTLGKLRDHGRVSPSFLAQISEIHLIMVKTFGEYKREGKLQYFLDSLSADRT